MKKNTHIMSKDILLWALGLMSTLFAGANIFQFIFFKSTKKKPEAEAESVTLDNQQKELQIREKGINDLLRQCDDTLERSMKMQTELQRLMMEVAELRATLHVKEKMIERITKEKNYYQNMSEHLENILNTEGYDTIKIKKEFHSQRTGVPACS